MTVNAITDTEKGRTGIAPTYLHTTRVNHYALISACRRFAHSSYAVGAMGIHNVLCIVGNTDFLRILLWRGR